MMLTDQQWKQIEDLFPAPPRRKDGRGRLGHRIAAVSKAAIERLIAEPESLAVDDQRDPHWLTVRAVIARVSPAHPRVVLRRPFHVAAGQVVKQHIKLGTE